jgi:hypothetical protein
MSHATVSRRRPCRHCGGRYFVGTISAVSAFVAFAFALGGIAIAVARSGVIKAVSSGIAPSGNVLQDAVWAIGGIVIAAVVVMIGHGYRCISCDAQQ